jgi:phytoene synthase
MSVSTEGGWHLDISFEECDELLAAPECKATPASYTADDFEQCSGFLHKGSSSFYAASKLLPEEVRRGTVMLYSFCRLADDLVDELGDPARALVILRRRLDRVYRGVPCDHAVDRGLLCAAETWGIPKAVFDALLEGFQWDSEERKYATIDELIEYCVRVASTVGVMMTLVMGERSLPALARACDLGVAFQLTNIARDVGEDARNGKVYLPESWLVDEGLSSAALMAKPEATEPLKRVVDRMLRVADQVYADAELGVRMLPGNCQSAVQAAHLIYKAIGGVLRDKLLLDSVNSRARTTGFVKIGWALLAVLQTKLIWPVKTALHGDARLELAWTMCEAFPEYTPLLAPFAAEEQRGVVPKPASECTHPANRATAKADKGNLEAALDRLAVWKGVRALPDGSPALGNGSWRTDNLSAPRDQVSSPCET